jgi:hypothetical protein
MMMRIPGEVLVVLWLVLVWSGSTFVPHCTHIVPSVRLPLLDS